MTDMTEVTSLRSRIGKSCLVVTLILACRWTAAAGPLVYVTNSSSNFVTVIDIASGKVVRRIAVGVEPFGIAFSPDGSFSYVANAKSSNVSVLRTRTALVEQAIPVSGKLPVWLAVSPDGSYICGDFNRIVLKRRIDLGKLPLMELRLEFCELQTVCRADHHDS